MFDDLDAEAFQGDDPAWMIGQQANRVQAEVGKNLRADTYFVLRGRLGQIAVVADELPLSVRNPRPV